MPDDKSVGVTKDEYQKDTDDFEKAADLLLEADDKKTDEELNTELDKELGTDPDTAGEATKDPDPKPEKDPTPAEDPIFNDGQKTGAADADPADAEPDKTVTKKVEDVPDGDIDWKVKAAELEAELKKEQQKTSSWDGRIKAANTRASDLAAEVEQLKLQLAKKPDPDAASDTEVLEKFGNDFPEMKEVIDVVLKKIASNKPTAAPAKADAVPASDDGSTPADVVPAESTHMKDIQKVHPDLAEMVNSGVLLTWIQKQKPFMKPHLEDIYYKGAATQVVDLCSQFKESTGWKSQLANKNSDKDLTKQQKLDALKEVNSESGGAPADGPDMNDFDKGAKDAGL